MDFFLKICNGIDSLLTICAGVHLKFSYNKIIVFNLNVFLFIDLVSHFFS